MKVSASSIKAPSLDISCVVFNSDPHWLDVTIDSLANAVSVAKSSQKLKSANLWLIDNHPLALQKPFFEELLLRYKTIFESIYIKAGHGNLGYGGGHNLAIAESRADYLLILNPDVKLMPDCLVESVNYLGEHPECVLVAPDVTDITGKRQYLAKRQPSFAVLLARAVNNKWLRKFFAKAMAKYEYQDKIPAELPVDIELASGCFMFLRGEGVRKLYGFNEHFFMYFEDFELSFRLRKLGALHYLPQVKIVHNGGAASKKGLRHIKYLIISFIRYKFIYWRGN